MFHFFIFIFFVYNLGVPLTQDVTGLGAAILASNFKITINNDQPQIFAPEPEMILIYDQKYICWSNYNHNK